MVKLKTKVSHTIDSELINWLDSEIEKRRFASRSHGLEYALAALKDRDEREALKTMVKDKIMDVD